MRGHWLVNTMEASHPDMGEIEIFFRKVTGKFVCAHYLAPGEDSASRLTEAQVMFLLKSTPQPEGIEDPS